MAAVTRTSVTISLMVKLVTSLFLCVSGLKMCHFLLFPGNQIQDKMFHWSNSCWCGIMTASWLVHRAYKKSFLHPLETHLFSAPKKKQWFVVYFFWKRISSVHWRIKENKHCRRWHPRFYFCILLYVILLWNQPYFGTEKYYCSFIYTGLVQQPYDEHAIPMMS